MTTRQLLRLFDQGHRITAPRKGMPVEVEHAPRSLHDPYPWRSSHSYPAEEVTVVVRYRSSELSVEYIEEPSEDLFM